VAVRRESPFAAERSERNLSAIPPHTPLSLSNPRHSRISRSTLPQLDESSFSPFHFDFARQDSLWRYRWDPIDQARELAASATSAGAAAAATEIDQAFRKESVEYTYLGDNTCKSHYLISTYRAGRASFAFLLLLPSCWLGP
jgi:hypothetical protein